MEKSAVAGDISLMFVLDWTKEGVGHCDECGFRSKCVSGNDNSLTSSGMFCRVSSFTFDTHSMSLFSDAFSKKALIPTHSPRSQFAVTLVTSRPEDAFIDLFANSILGATMLSIAAKIAF